MIFTGLQLDNVRALQHAEFEFQSGMNLVVGDNGVGKSTTLDALRIAASRVLRTHRLTHGALRSLTFDRSDITVGFPVLKTQVDIRNGATDFVYSRTEWRDNLAIDDAKVNDRLRQELIALERTSKRPRKLLRDLATPLARADSDSFFPQPPNWTTEDAAERGLPLVLFYATTRSVLLELGKTRSRATSEAGTGQSGAYRQALDPRPWDITELAQWIRVQEALGEESPEARQLLDLMRQAASTFIPDSTNLYAVEVEGSPRLHLEKHTVDLDVSQLSDGERGVLSMTLDLARRLCQVNPHLKNPLATAEAIVLIDELDLHLHPRWQRQIVHKLQETFPKCQFIATTHSPQIIGEVPGDRIQIIDDGVVYSPRSSYGLDSTSVLLEVMNTDARTEEIDNLLSDISGAIGQNEFENARRLIEQLAKSTEAGETHPEVTRLRTLLDFAEGAD